MGVGKFFKKAGKAVGRFAPMLGTVLGGPAGGAIASVVASALGVEATDDAIASAVANDPEAAVKLRQIEASEKIRLEQMVYEDLADQRARDREQLSQTGQTMRAELVTRNTFKSGWRPFIGWSVGIQMLLLVLVICAAFTYMTFFPASQVIEHGDEMVVVTSAEMMASAAGLITALWPIIGAELLVLGVVVGTRNRSKEIDAGFVAPATGVLGALAGRLRGG